MAEPEPTTEPTERYQVVQSMDCVRYTDPNQFAWFETRITEAFGGLGVNLRFDPDGTTLRWYGYYVLPLGWWLVSGRHPIDDESLRAADPYAWKPLPEWPPAES